MTMSETKRLAPVIQWEGLREWLDQIQTRLPKSEFRIVKNATWQDDIGAITEMLDHTQNSPSVLFDDVPGYPTGHRVLVNTNGTIARQAITLGLDPDTVTHEVLLDYWSNMLGTMRPIPPEEISQSQAPICENIQRGDDIDLEGFPAVRWHPKAQRYIGTASINILREPTTGWINMGTYRNQVLDKNHLGLWISPGKHGRMIRDGYFNRGEKVPIVVCVGSDPLLFMAACSEAPAFGADELAWAGAVRGKPVPIIRGEVTGLPIPAWAEVAIEGWVDPVERRPEGPYGEAYGYYSAAVGGGPFVTIERIYHRNNPILLGCPQGKPPHEDNRFGAYLRSSLIGEQLRGMGIPNITGTWVPPEAGNRGFVVVAVKQSYAGHAMQAGLAAAQVGGSAYLGRYVVVVDEDVDIYDMNDVWFAMFTRVDPQRDIHFLDKSWAGPLDQAIAPELRGENSRAVIDATRPYEWKDRFAEPVVTKEMAKATREKWCHLLQL